MKFSAAPLLILAIFLSGCVGARIYSDVSGAVPTQNLPDSLKFLAREDITSEYAALHPSDTSVRKAATFLYSSKNNRTVAQIDVFELKNGKDIDFEERERKRIKDNMDALRKMEPLNSFSENAADVQGFPTRHFREKFYFTKYNRSVLFSTIDVRFLRAENAVIRISVVQRHLFYEEILPYLENETAHAPEYKKYRETDLALAEAIGRNLAEMEESNSAH